MRLPDEIPEWADWVVKIAVGGAGVRLLTVWLENRRLVKSDYRESLLKLIRELQDDVQALSLKVGQLEEALEGEQELVLRLQDENDELRSRLADASDAREDLLERDSDPDR